MRGFEPHPLLRNPHLMTLAAHFWPRRLEGLPRAVPRLFQVEPGSRILGQCHWQSPPERHPTLALVHGLEGSSDSAYMLGTARLALARGFNVLRLNQRNCGGTEDLTPTLYNSGLSGDCRAVLSELIERDALPEIFFAGYSMGGNLVLKMAAELGTHAPLELRAVSAVAPALDLAACADAIALPPNFLYQWYFLRGLKARLHRKARLFPGHYALDGLRRMRTLREFDDAITAPCSGYRDAVDYYFRASAIRAAAQIHVPTLILTAQDDPFVPFASFGAPGVIANRRISLMAPPRGGHCGFISRHAGEERFWAEARVVEFCEQHSELAAG